MPIHLLAMFTPAPLPTNVVPEPVLGPAKIIKLKALPKPKFKKFKSLPFAGFKYYPYGTFSNTYAPLNCTSYVASRKKIPNSWGDANTWAMRARAMGVTVSNSPVVGAIAQSSRGYWGHVALTLKVTKNRVLVAEQNYDMHGSIRQKWFPKQHFVYIYI